MTTIGIIGAGEVGAAVAKAVISLGYKVVIANSRGPETLTALVGELGPSARAATAAEAAKAGDFAVIAVPLKLTNNMPVDELAGKIVLDTNNYMIWRDGNYPIVDSGEKTIYELRQEHLPTSKVVQAFTHIQAPRLGTIARPAGAPDRIAVPISSNYPEAVAFVADLFDRLGFDTVDNSPLSEAWRSAPGQPAWVALNHQYPDGADREAPSFNRTLASALFRRCIGAWQLPQGRGRTWGFTNARRLLGREFSSRTERHAKAICRYRPSDLHPTVRYCRISLRRGFRSRGLSFSIVVYAIQ